MLKFQAAAYTSQDFSWLQNGQVNWVSSASMFFFRASGFRLDFLRPILALVHKSETPRSIVTANFISSTKQLREEEKSSSACRPYFWQWSPVPQAQQQHLQEPTVQLQNLGHNFQHSIGKFVSNLNYQTQPWQDGEWLNNLSKTGSCLQVTESSVKESPSFLKVWRPGPKAVGQKGTQDAKLRLGKKPICSEGKHLSCNMKTSVAP